MRPMSAMSSISVSMAFSWSFAVSVWPADVVCASRMSFIGRCTTNRASSFLPRASTIER